MKHDVVVCFIKGVSAACDSTVSSGFSCGFVVSWRHIRIRRRLRNTRCICALSHSEYYKKNCLKVCRSTGRFSGDLISAGRTFQLYEYHLPEGQNFRLCETVKDFPLFQTRSNCEDFFQMASVSYIF